MALGRHPKYPLILIGNRDEFHARPAAPISLWPDGSGIMAGRDIQAGGTWLGVHPTSGRVVVVTNVRGALPDPDKASRGALVTQMLTGQGEYANPSPAILNDFNAFNLIIAQNGTADILTNRPSPNISQMSQGIIAVANEPMTIACPRALRLQAVLERCTATGADPAAMLDDLMQEDSPALFLRGDEYGTRASTLVTIDHDGQIDMVERRYEAGGRPSGTTALTGQMA